MWETERRESALVVEGNRLIVSYDLIEAEKKILEARELFLKTQERVRKINDDYNAIPDDFKKHLRAFVEYLGLDPKDQRGALFPMFPPFLPPSRIFSRMFDEPRVGVEDVKWEHFDPAKHQ